MAKRLSDGRPYSSRRTHTVTFTLHR